MIDPWVIPEDEYGSIELNLLGRTDFVLAREPGLLCPAGSRRRLVEDADVWSKFIFRSIVSGCSIQAGGGHNPTGTLPQ